MGESPTCLLQSFSQPAGTTSTEPKEGDPYCALTTSISFRSLVARRKAYFEALYKRNGAKKPTALLEEQNAACNEPNVMEETSRDSSNPPQIPTRVLTLLPCLHLIHLVCCFVHASANGLSMHSSTAPQEERRRSKPVDDCSVSRRIADGKPVDLMFVTAEPFEDHLILTVEDRVGPNKDEVLRKVIVPLSSVERRADDHPVHSCWYNVQKPSSNDVEPSKKDKDKKNFY
ncbi:FT-interacting protein 3 [Camellia lanceoleosa]|uniref:FT-interacting protein 3 n=1 Tax=Camellia lanceoleosa TaxID=1840588 RepID=A0ACC0ILS7_9ERIC|nr:FT-interacting protein 3 [Camellia lanceoleosa]